MVIIKEKKQLKELLAEKLSTLETGHGKFYCSMKIWAR